MTEIYPTIVEGQELDGIINDRLSASRAQEMLSKRKELTLLLSRYNKLEMKWSKADCGVKCVGFVLVMTAGIGATVISGGTLLPVTIVPIVAGVLSGTAVVNGILSETIILGLTSRKKKHYRRKKHLVNDYLNKLYLYFEKAVDDKIINIDEVIEFRSIYEEFQSKLQKFNCKMDKEDELFIEKLQKESKRVALREVRQEVKKDMTEKAKKKIIQRFGSQLSVVSE